MVAEDRLAQLSSVQGAALEQPKRKRIYTWLQHRPGSNRNQIASGLGVFYNSVDYHIDRMLDYGLVVERESVKDDILLFRTRDVSLWDNENTRILYGRSPTRNVAIRIYENPGVTAPEIAEAIDTSLSTVRVHLRTLKGHDLSDAVTVDGWETYHPTPVLSEWINGPGQGYLEPLPFEEEPLNA